MDISPELASQLRLYMTKEQPLGPIDSAKIEDQEVGKALFERDNKLHLAMKKNPAVIVGRRGAGKTAYLDTLHYDSQYQYVIPFNALDPFAAIVHRIQKTSIPSTLVEAVADEWRCSLLTIIFADVLRRNEQESSALRKTRRYLHSIGIRLPRSNKEPESEDALMRVVNTLSLQRAPHASSASQELSSAPDWTAFAEALDEVTAFLLARKEQAIVLIDSLDDYPLPDASVGRAISGLLKCVGMFNRPGKPFHVRFCLPAELYPSFLELSSNPSKDFERELVLNWHSRELLYVIAQRLKLYYFLYDKELYSRVKNVEYDNMAGAREIVHTCLPVRVTNAHGRPEASLTYLFRHTQLLPRQALELLNNVLNRALAAGGVGPLYPNHVVDGIAQVEPRLASQIFSAFKLRHPTAEAACKRCIPELESTFTVQQLEEVFRRFGRQAFQSKDHHDFRTMLIETGVIGVVTNETDNYIEGLFEYSAPQQLHMRHTDRLCIHPIFSGVFRCRRPEDSSHLKPIYPYGTDVNTEDVRTLYT